MSAASPHPMIVSTSITYHAPVDGRALDGVARISKAIGAERVVFHDVFWEDEWRKIARLFSRQHTKVCVENTRSVHEPVKFMRRYGMGRCLDLEHLEQRHVGRDVPRDVFHDPPRLIGTRLPPDFQGQREGGLGHV